MKIGLALSGGGFRASLFHLGVIRRLEELGIMKDVAVVSSVSGGSIIAAYYLVQMESRLRGLPPGSAKLPVAEQRLKRLEIFEAIAKDFSAALDHNLRSRAIIFTPFYHPLLFVKTLFMKAFRGRARAELIQGEYDRFFYDRDTLDQLPSVIRDKSDEEAADSLAGPKLVLNTTSLLSGERKAFSREPNTKLEHLDTPDNNFLRLSQVVGASSGVPVLFPPTWVRGELLVDGGVADNQGIEGLNENQCDVLIVSDASGQLEALDSMGTGEATVYGRVSDIFQFQIRKKLLADLKAKRAAGSEVSFVHLYMNLKDLEAERNKAIPRISSSLIPGLARIRTDLDQFDLVERESLMYHGYTLIDADLRESCPRLLQDPKYSSNEPMRVPPLFAKTLSDAERGKIRDDLEAGSQGVFLLRSLSKYPKLMRPIYAFGGLLWIGFALGLLALDAPFQFVEMQVLKALEAVVPVFLRSGVHTPEWLTRLPLFLPGPFRHFVDAIDMLIGGVSALAAFFVVWAVPLYLVIFGVFALARRVVRRADYRAYTHVAGQAPTLRWASPNEGL